LRMESNRCFPCAASAAPPPAKQKAVAKAPVDLSKMSLEELKALPALSPGVEPVLKRVGPMRRVAPRSGHADLIVEEMIFTGMQGPARVYKFKIKNAGDVPSGPFRATVACTPENVPVGTSQYTYLTQQWCRFAEGTYFQVPSIGPGQSQLYLKVEVVFPPPPASCANPAGARPRYFFNVDSLNQVDEGSPAAEENNEDSFVICL
ncbi:MAG: hypothetical protein KJ058_11325, partial [Thermoanaerobaculia bacterium]|nr:hypothetical protein [Thermoanaerobaculia bacterium]